MSAEPRSADGYCSGSRDGRESVALRLERSAGRVTLALFGPSMGRQPIYGVHEGLRPVMESLPDGAELYYLCRVAEGTYLNVNNLIAVEIDGDRRSRSDVLQLPEALVTRHPVLLAQRAASGMSRQAVNDARKLLAQGVSQELFWPVWQALPQAGRDELAEQYLAWAPPFATSRTGLSPAKWPDDWLAVACVEAFGGPTFDALFAELERRGPSPVLADLQQRVAAKRAHDALCKPARLRPDLLERLLGSRTPGEIAIYADTLSEDQHPYGEFLTLSLHGTEAAQRKAKSLAGRLQETWWGPLSGAIECTYVNGLPHSALVIATPTDVAAACAHPLLPFLRAATCHKSGLTRRCDVEPSAYVAMAKVMLRHSLVELDCFADTLNELINEDLSPVRRLHDVNVLALQPGALTPARVPALEWLQVRVAPGTLARVVEWLRRDVDRLLSSGRPALDLVLPSGASAVELQQAREAAAGFRDLPVTLNGAT